MNIVIMSGISCSGKSTYVKEHSTEDSAVCSADRYFTVGKWDPITKSASYTYNFDPTKLGEAHAACMKRFIEACHEDVGYDTLFVDNTNTTIIELAPYVAVANAFGYRPDIVTIHCSAEEAHRRDNGHNVPLAAKQRMAQNIASREIPRFWNATIIDV